MFSKSEKSKPTELTKSNGSSVPTSTVNIICAGTTVEGVIKSNADLRIDGTVKGDVYSKNKIVIGTAGAVIGDVNCKLVDVHGKVTGNIYTEELIVLKTKSEVKGDVTAKQLSIEVGAKFVGASNMDGTFKVENKLSKSNPSISPNSEHKQKEHG